MIGTVNKLFLLLNIVCHGARVSVKLSRNLAVPPAAAKAAWLDFVWERGGGLPLVKVILSDEHDDHCGRDCRYSKRTLLPLFMREELLPLTSTRCPGASGNNDSGRYVEYTVTETGMLFDIVEGSHLGVVQFASLGDGIGSDDVFGTKLSWCVEFECRARAAVWEKVTQITVGTVLSNLQAYLAQPAVFSLTMKPLAGSPQICLAAWLECLEDGDLGIPLPPPIVLNDGVSSPPELGRTR